MSSNAPREAELSAAAAALGTTESLIEKDWHVVQLLAHLAAAPFADVILIFCGGTSLSKAHQAIKRFSEDVDLRCVQTDAEALSSGVARRQRKAFFDRVVIEVANAGYQVLTEATRDEHRSMKLELGYPTVLAGRQDPGLRPHLLLELSFHPPNLALVPRSVRSFIGEQRGERAEIPDLPCLDPLETCADKLSALLWRLTAAHLKTRPDTYRPELMRHVHDLAALETVALRRGDEFRTLARRAIAKDLARGHLEHIEDTAAALGHFREALEGLPMLEADYGRFVAAYLYAPASERLAYAQAKAALLRLTDLLSHAPAA